MSNIHFLIAGIGFLKPQVQSQTSRLISAVWPGSILLIGKLNMFIFIFLELAMDSSKYIARYIHYKKESEGLRGGTREARLNHNCWNFTVYINLTFIWQDMRTTRHRVLALIRLQNNRNRTTMKQRIIFMHQVWF